MRKAVVSDGGHRWSGWAGPFWDNTGAAEWVGDRQRSGWGKDGWIGGGCLDQSFLPRARPASTSRAGWSIGDPSPRAPSLAGDRGEPSESFSLPRSLPRPP